MLHIYQCLNHGPIQLPIGKGGHLNAVFGSVLLLLRTLVLWPGNIYIYTHVYIVVSTTVSPSGIVCIHPYSARAPCDSKSETPSEILFSI